MSNLLKHAEYELKRAGLFSKDSDYGGMLGHATMRLMKVFAKEGHSGMSAEISTQLFERLARFKPLTPLTNSPDEWLDRSEQSGRPLWQNKRQHSVFSTDGGKTWYDLDAPKRKWWEFWKR